MIQVDDLRFTYPGAAKSTLHGLDFAIGRGEVFGFLGPSGAGKSTTTKSPYWCLKAIRRKRKSNGKRD